MKVAAVLSGLLALALAVGVGCAHPSDVSDPSPPPGDVSPIGAPTAPPVGTTPAAAPAATAVVPKSTVKSVMLSIGPAGGTLHHPDGVDLVVPAGALAQPTVLTLEPIDAPLASALGAEPIGQAFAAGPDGQQFLRPVELRMHFDPAKLPAGATTNNVIVRMAPHATNDFVSLAATVDPAASTVTVKTTHFTDFIPSADLNPVFITTTGLPSGIVSAPYAAPLAAKGGVSPYVWTASAGAVLPPGLSVATSGQLAGTPTTVGNYPFFITVSDSAGRAVQSAFSVTVNPAVNPLPVFFTMSPTSAPINAPDTTITITGGAFVPASQVICDGKELVTTFVSPTSLTATIDAWVLAIGGAHSIAVRTPAPGGGTSGALSFTVVVPPAPPVITAVSPAALPVSAVATQVTVTGSNFKSSSSVAIGTSGIPTSYVSSTSLVATIPASYLASDGTLVLDVYTPTPPGGGYSATTVLLPVGAITNVPVLDALSPRWAAVGSADFTLDVTGSGFVAGGKVFFGVQPLTTTVTSSTTAQATVPASLVTERGSQLVRFVNPTPGGGASATQTFGVGPEPIAWQTLASGAVWTSCGLAAGGGLYCWGANGNGTQGDGSSGASVLWPARAASGRTFDSVSASAHICALSAGDVFCWGVDDQGQAGTGGTKTRPTAVLAGTKFSTVSAGRSQSCAITTAGALLCWGKGYGSPGAATNVIAGTYTAVSSSQDLVCALDTTGGAHCWGANAKATWSLAGYSFTSISADFTMACGLTAAGDAYCWGGSVGSCYTGTSSASPTTPELLLMPAGVKLAQISNGCFSSAGVATNGDLYTWGRTVGDPTNHPPARMPGVPPMRSVNASSGDWSCALSTTNERFCWGSNGYGQLGDGTTTKNGTPELGP